MAQLINSIAFIGGIGLGIFITIFPRFGEKSWHLLFLILPVCFSAGVQAFGARFLNSNDLFIISFAFIILAAGGGYLACAALKKPGKTPHVIPAGILAAILAALLFLITPDSHTAGFIPEGYIPTGPAGYIAAIFLLIISVIVLANIEQILRNSFETARWEIFLFLGIGALHTTIIYLSSRTLLYSTRDGLLYTEAIGLFHIMFLISGVLIAVAWKLSSGKAPIAVSHNVVYSFITLLSVGAYLIASSLIARMVERWGNVGLPVEVLIFLVSAVALAVALLGTGLRHKTRTWLRRNIFAGRYDYRQFWIEATERIQSINTPAETARALAEITHKALGAENVSVWLRLWNPTQLQLLISTGTAPISTEYDLRGIVEQLMNILEPVSLKDLDDKPNIALVKKFIADTGSVLLVPLQSGNRIVGALAVGKDPSGRKYTRESREFLRVLAGHAAGEFHKSDLLSSIVSAKEDEAFRSFSTFVLHDLKNFASTLSYIAQNAPRHHHNPEFQQDAFQSVYDTAEKMKRLCNSLKTFSGSLAADQKPADLNKIVRAVAESLHAGLQKHLMLDLPNIPQVSVDAEEVGRVLQNLLLNAREAISENGVITVKTRHYDDKIEIVVEDDGAGMSREFIENELFVPFHTTKSSGLGIGLFQSKKIMEAHHGGIYVESEEGHGTRIRLVFPIND